jgi:hypothetical protein
VGLTRNLFADIGTDNVYLFDVWQQTLDASLTRDENEAVLTAAIAAGTAVPENVAGWAVSFVLLKSDKAADASTPQLVLTTTGGAITITGVYNVDPDVNTQALRVFVADTDIPLWNGTAGFKQKTYRYSLKRTDAGSETIIAKGNFDLTEATQR